jgi:hypothetical protein
MQRWLWFVTVSLLFFISCGKVEDPKDMSLKPLNKKDVILPVYAKEVVKISLGETKKIPILVKNPIAVARKYSLSIEPEAPEGWVIAVCEGEACYPWAFESEIGAMGKKVFQVQVQAPEEETSVKKIDSYFVFYPVNEPEFKVKVHIEITLE